ncbi:TIGR03643 family protein [Limnohabitans sp. T6-20]|uniref:TIGR03643 family protein n=1 Tax=Limnohabitans sp. T6-20 TaxID=1100725 RepID=UPI000D371027|nr:TIGR03643 family protein [Limnohabitans sp. T6-20]PUE07773.1 TIGR03643 family protein [Limnohabitans sp. T6-20]
MNSQDKEHNMLSEADISNIIAMAWQDDTPFEAIALQFTLSETEVIALMRENLKARSFRVWRVRVRGRAAKHQSRQLNKDRVFSHQASAAAMDQALAEADKEVFPLPPSALTRESLR